MINANSPTSGATPLTQGETGKIIRTDSLALDKGLQKLRDMELTPPVPLGRWPVKKFWISVYCATLLTLIAMSFIFVAPVFSTQRCLLVNVVFSIFSAFFIAPAITSATMVVFRMLAGEQIEQSNYIVRLVHDMKNARALREELNCDRKLKMLSAHVKREIDRTSDITSLLSQILIIGGTLIGGILLTVGETDSNSQIAVIGTLGAAITIFARLFALYRLWMLRQWQAVIEQAQNIDLNEQSPQPIAPSTDMK